MKLTKAQLLYLRSAAINPDGRTYIPSQDGTLQKLVELGLVIHVGANAAYLNSAGRAVLEAQEEARDFLQSLGKEG